MADNRAKALADFKRIMVWIVGLAVLLVVLALAYLYATGDLNRHMVIATMIGVFFSMVLGAGLFAAAFFSDKSGHDQSISDSTKSSHHQD